MQALAYIFIVRTGKHASLVSFKRNLKSLTSLVAVSSRVRRSLRLYILATSALACCIVCTRRLLQTSNSLSNVISLGRTTVFVRVG